MATLDARVAELESRVCTLLETLESFSVQLMMIQDFLQKQFGPRFIDYVATHGVLIEKPNKPVFSDSVTAATSTFLSNEEDLDPMSYLEIEIGTEGEQVDSDNSREYNGEEENPEDEVYYEERREEGMMMGENDKDEEDEEYRQDSVGVGTTKPKAKAAYNNKKWDKSASKKGRLPSNFLGRKRSANTSTGECPAPKMPVLQPQIEASSYGYVGLEGILDYRINEGGLGDGLYEGHKDLECNEDLKEYYDVLPDKSVQCKICDKILRAGWHKFGRHFRTHTLEKPFCCPTCGERFARKDNMKSHIKSKHENNRAVCWDNVTMASSEFPVYSPPYYLSN